ncbi:FHA domain-containing protein FhaB/FipA [Janibacter massiliensis]|uniref:FHA domain-containing protein FhaB/FipA n=1 Tax=Janibacter massiliensis TaxID=2058291 RepID=UPI000D10D7AF|nr:FHA domain-containing protein [Janibacter massiliensis]
MSELTLLVMRLALLALLWFFVFSLATILRGDLYGTRVVARTAKDRGDAKVKPAKRRLPRPVRTQNESAALVVTAGGLAGTSLRLKPGGTLIGRNPECALVLDDDYASGRHCRVFHDGSGWVVEDLGSTNGTFVGNRPITEPTPISPGGSIRIGRTVIELRR